jgi:hypothetical protein
VKVVDPQKSPLDAGNCYKLQDGELERSSYALRETYTEFKTFEKGTYYMYVKLDWNGEAATKDFAVNCYAPSNVNFLSDEST